MKTNKQKSLHALDSRSLPVLPPGAPYLLKTLTDESIDFPQLSCVLERFPTIAARLIALANSAWSSPVTTISSLEAACARIGFSVVRSTSIALAVAFPFNPSRCPAFDAPRFWCRALLVADASCWLAQAATDGPAPETARAAGLLHNLGLLWLADQLPQETHEVLLEHAETPSNWVGVLFIHKLGFDYADAGGLLGETWGLPSPLVGAMKHHRKPQTSLSEWEYASIVGHAAAMAQAAEQQDSWMVPDSLKPSLGISPEDASRIFTQVTNQLTKTRELAQTLFGT